MGKTYGLLFNIIFLVFNALVMYGKISVGEPAPLQGIFVGVHITVILYYLFM